MRRSFFAQGSKAVVVGDGASPAMAAKPDGAATALWRSATTGFFDFRTYPTRRMPGGIQPSERSTRARHVLILVENLPVPFDRRVWQEASALRDAGYEVSVICPAGKGHDALEEVIDGISIFRHPLPEARCFREYPREYASALASQMRLSLRVHRRKAVDVIQACNPPDLLFLVALVHKALFGTRFVFDHHDLNPELYVSKFGRKDFVWRLLRLLERLTFGAADASIATNEGFKELAVRRGGMRPDDVQVVKSYPEISRFRRCDPDPGLVALEKRLVGYIGIMGEQDGVDMFLRGLAHLVHAMGRKDVFGVVIGDGPQLGNLQRLAAELDIEGSVRFTGYLRGEALLSHLSAIEVGVIPDPPNEFNGKLSMNKVFEYMMLGIPFVQFDLEQARRDADGAGVVVEHTAEAMACGIAGLIDDAELRAGLSEAALAKARRDFQWSTEAASYVATYESLFARWQDVHDQRYHPAS